MEEGQPGGMEHLARSLPPVFLEEAGVGALAVHLVAQQWEAQVGQMDADLVGPAGVQSAFDPGGALQSLMHRYSVQASRPSPGVVTAIFLRWMG